jgi:hypothetical protein
VVNDRIIQEVAGSIPAGPTSENQALMNFQS